MGFSWEIVGKGGFQFFGKISASISHDIKNVLAVLNENAGLLEDLVLMAEKGASFNHERVKSLANSMRKVVPAPLWMRPAPWPTVMAFS